LIAAYTKVFPVVVVDQLLRDFEGAFFFVDVKSKDIKYVRKRFLTSNVGSSEARRPR
jgi:hypothetical protein